MTTLIPCQKRSFDQSLVEGEMGSFAGRERSFQALDRCRRVTLKDMDASQVIRFGKHRSLFDCRFPDVSAYRRDFKPLLEVICVQRASLPLTLLSNAIGLDAVECRERLRSLGSNLPLRESCIAEEAVLQFPKSIAIWLTNMDEKTGRPVSGDYVIDTKSGESRLAVAVLKDLSLDCHEADPYSLRYGPAHLVAAGQKAAAAKLLADFGYHHARGQRFGADDVEEVIRDFSLVAEVEFPSQLGEQLAVWQRFYSEISRYLLRSGVNPETEWLQRAYAHAERSPVSQGAEAWLKRTGTKRWWLRKLGRPEDIEAGARSSKQEGNSDSVWQMALHADGRRALATSGDNLLKLWDLETGACLWALNDRNGGWVHEMAIHADGRRAATVSNDKLLKVWDLKTGACLGTLKGHTDSVKAVTFHSDGRRAVSASEDKTLKVWDLKTGACLRTLKGHTSWVNAVAVQAGGSLAVSASGDNTLKVWNLETGRCLHTLKGHTCGVHTVVLHGDGRRAVSTSLDKTLKVWDPKTGECLATLPGHIGGALDTAVHEDGLRVVSSGNYLGEKSAAMALEVIDLESGASLSTLKGHTDSVVSAVFCAGGSLIVSASEDNTLKVWNVETGACLATWFGEYVFESIYIAELPTGRVRAAAIDKNQAVHLFEIMPPGRMTADTRAVAWHPSHPLLAAADDECVICLHAWHPESHYLEEIARCEIDSAMEHLQWSENGDILIATMGNGAERAFDGATLEEFSPVPFVPPVEVGEISHDGRWRAVIRGGRLEVEAVDRDGLSGIVEIPPAPFVEGGDS